MVCKRFFLGNDLTCRINWGTKELTSNHLLLCTSLQDEREDGIFNFFLSFKEFHCCSLTTLTDASFLSRLFY